ncbi:MAG: type IV pilus assembly protein PilM [Candidatus Moranbacteria bacterium]|nr:type IV pilus assembly protein PilM [Candidatus Moranbacteria bacterium]
MFFGIGKPYFLGVDFGTSLIKAVELTVENGKPTLVNYGEVDLARLEKGIMTGDNDYDQELVLYLRALLQKFQPKSDGAYAAMPAFTGLISLIELPEMNEDDLKEAIQFEAHKYVPSSLEDVALSWEVVGSHPTEDGSGSAKMEILLVAALNKEVARYRKYVQEVHLKMNFLELETFSLVRSIIDHRPGVFLVVDIGSRATNLVLVDDGLVKVSRNLDAGGKDITRTLTEGLSITAERAEALKKSDKDFLNQRESALVFPALEMIASEAKRMLSAYRERYPEKSCQEIILSGGTAQLTGLTTYYTQVFGVPVHIGDPWEGISYDPSVAKMVAELGTSFSVALGLAMVGIDETTHQYQAPKKPFSLKALLTKKI